MAVAESQMATTGVHKNKLQQKSKSCFREIQKKVFLKSTEKTENMNGSIILNVRLNVFLYFISSLDLQLDKAKSCFMKNLFLGTLLLFSISTAEAQNQRHILDSLKRGVAKTNDAKTYFDIAHSFYPQRRLDSVLFYYQKALAYTDDKKLEIQIRKRSGLIYLRTGFSALAQEQFFKGLKTALELKDSTEIALAYSNLAEFARNANLYDKAIQYCEEGLKFNPNENTKILIKNVLGQALTHRKALYKAVSVFQEILPQMEKSPSNYSATYNSVGNTFMELKNYDSAYKYAALALSIDEALHDSVSIMWNRELLGRYYFGVNQFSKAKSFLHSALRLNEKFGDDEWHTFELPKLYQVMNVIYSAEHKTDSLLWLKNHQAMLYRRLWEDQKKRTAEFAFNSQEDEVKALLQKEKKIRKGLTQYYGIALVLLLCILVYFILSGRDSQRRYAPYISIVLLVFLFEFLLVVLDPFIGNITNDEPLYQFIVNVLLALLLAPVHFFGQRLLKQFALDIRIKKVE
jgi:tetratricopeptide (TPR) repeat protein